MTKIQPVPAVRVRTLGGAGESPPGSGDYVLYWMVAQRRARWSFALQHAAWQAERLGKPLLILEALRVGYPYASDRLHHFVLDGMADNAARFAAAGVRYLPYVEREAGAGKGLLAALAKRACVVVSDDYPCFFIPRMQESAARQIAAPLELVDGNGIIPLRAADSAFSTAHAFRRFVQRHGVEPLLTMPLADPLARLDVSRKARLPAGLRDRWPLVRPAELAADRRLVAELPIDHAVARAPDRGGSLAGERRMQEFLTDQLDGYLDNRNHPDRDATSKLSPWLHFGQLGAHQLVAAVLEREDWDPGRLGDARVTRGARSGWWGVSPAAEAFLDQAVIWRELGQQFCWHVPNYAEYRSLPAWARTTLAEHRRDPRPERYSLARLEAAETGDELWNASQRQLLIEGRIHNYLRMLWGKRILEWSATPQQALDRMILLNDKYALDGRDPNSYSGIFWVLGRFDRAWGPERPIFGKIRYMSSANTRKKLQLDDYLRRFAAR
ncbi:MAG TPA: deoxyribodipyrimidine photolyase [Enhygromyxa sp.]|nr:deoxyribodipyrimidine photolyase [Enhygromyxa sp.]